MALEAWWQGTKSRPAPPLHAFPQGGTQQATLGCRGLCGLLHKGDVGQRRPGASMAPLWWPLQQEPSGPYLWLLLVLLR